MVEFNFAQLSWHANFHLHQTHITPVQATAGRLPTQRRTATRFKRLNYLFIPLSLAHKGELIVVTENRLKP